MELDLLIIGGGINGVGIAADAASRGLSVGLFEQADLGSGTSSASSKLIHGGLRYLEHYQFRLVYEALRERNLLLQRAPHLVQPLEFVLPLVNSLRPRWLISLGLKLYDALNLRGPLPSSRPITWAESSAKYNLKPSFQQGFSYFDAYADDARLVIANAQLARQLGAKIFTYHECVNACRKHNRWQVNVRNLQDGTERCIMAKAIINAAGPWAGAVNAAVFGSATPAPLKLVKGSHIVLPRLYAGNHAYILQNVDQRMVFIIPFESDYSLVGTTEIIYPEIAEAKITPQEIDYLLAVVERYLNVAVTDKEVVWTYAGLRALYDDHAQNPSAITREYKLECEVKQHLPLINVIGGKLTTYRALAEKTVDLLIPLLDIKKRSQTTELRLPGGELSRPFSEFVPAIQRQYPWLPESLALRYAKSYGSMLHPLLAGASSLQDLGIHFGANLYQREVDYLRANEWACTIEDIVWRRTKLGLHLAEIDSTQLAAYLATK